MPQTRGALPIITASLQQSHNSRGTARRVESRRRGIKKNRSALADVNTMRIATAAAKKYSVERDTMPTFGRVGNTCTPRSKMNIPSCGSKKSVVRRARSSSELLYTDEYVSFEDIRLARFAHTKKHSKREEHLIASSSRRSPSKSSSDTMPSNIIINKTMSDDSSLTIEDSQTTLDGLNIDLPSQVGHIDRSRVVQFKKVVMVHNYNADASPVCMKNIVDGFFKKPSVVRRLGLYEKIALFEKRPDLAPFYNHRWSTGIEELVLAPTLETSEKALQISKDACNFVADRSMEKNTINGRRGDSHDTRQYNEYNDTLSLLDVEGDSRDETDEDRGDHDDRSVDVGRLCRLYGPLTVDRILGCMKGE